MKIPVWSCSEERWNSRKNLIVYDDQGSLEYGKQGWTYHGRKTQSAAITITQVELARPAFPWVAQSIGMVVILGFAALLSILLLDAEFSIIMGMGMTFGFVVGLIINRIQEWVVVTGEDTEGNAVTGRFHDSGALGWMGLLGGNRRLAQALEDHRVRGD